MSFYVVRKSIYKTVFIYTVNFSIINSLIKRKCMCTFESIQTLKFLITKFGICEKRNFEIWFEIFTWIELVEWRNLRALFLFSLVVNIFISSQKMKEKKKLNVGKKVGKHVNFCLFTFHSTLNALKKVRWNLSEQIFN